MTRPLILGLPWQGSRPPTDSGGPAPIGESGATEPNASTAYEFTTRPRDFIVVSLATHDDKGEATWHRLVAWNGDQLCHRNLRFAGKGDRVKVQVRRETFVYTDDDGTERKLRQLIVLRFRVLKRMHIPPEIP